MSIGRELLNVPFDEMVYNLGSAIAHAQTRLDAHSIDILEVMGDAEEAPVYMPDYGLPGEEPIVTSMIGAGFQPTFYQFSETVIEVKMAITTNYTSEREYNVHTDQRVVEKKRKGWFGSTKKKVLSTSTIDAKYSSKYNFSQEGTSTLKTRLVPVPPNDFIQKQIELKAELEKMQVDLALQELEILLLESSLDEE